MSFTHYLQTKNYTNSTIKNYTRRKEVFLEWLEKERISIKDARYTDLLVYLRHLSSSGHSKHYMNQQLTVIRHYYNYLIKLRKVNDNIAANLFVKGVLRRLPHDILSEEDLNEVYKNFPVRNITGKRNKIILGLIIYQGLTSSELTRLEPWHILLKEGKINVPGSRRSNSRLLELKAQQMLDLQEYVSKTRNLLLEITEKKSDKLFISIGTSDRFSNILLNMLPIVREYMPKVKSVHQLRASVITHWLSKENIREVQYKAGHKYISSTEKFQQTNLEDLQKDVNTYHPLK